MNVPLPTPLPLAPVQAVEEDGLWYKDAVIYQLHVKSFFDANNDGVGDFPGPAGEAGLHRRTRRHGDLAAAVLPFAAAG